MGVTPLRLFYFRTILFISYTSLLIIDFFFKTDTINFVINYKLLNSISILHLFYIYVIIDMLSIIIPLFNKHSFNGKHLNKFYQEEPNYNKDKLKAFTRKYHINALKSAIFWILLNAPFIILYFLGIIDQSILYWLFFFYYFADVFCINIFCLFHFALIKSKCCNECRIYNWSYFMYSTPLLFMPNPWNITLGILSIIILIWWELSTIKHPERFSHISNKTLQCKHCNLTCRYKKKNKLEKIIYSAFKKEAKTIID